MTEKRQPKQQKPFEKMTVKELREIAIDIPHEHTEVAVLDMNKGQLVAFIKQARGIGDDEPSPQAKKIDGRVKVVLTRQEIKAKIRQLKETKAAAAEQKDWKSASGLRCRISRLKKLSRKTA